jgi:tRNA threonylcarbamoyladenosine biosynthesis protein TsaE
MKLDFAITTKSAEETLDTGMEIAKHLGDKSIITLYGDLGSGKTHLVKGICKGLGVEQTVNSPTFIIVNEYSSPAFPLIYHFDLYRMKSQNEVLDMGFDDYITNGNIILIEWPEHVEDILPPDTIKIHLAHTSANENERWIKVEAAGVR